ncbi:hypothetical protein BKA93DRAFT_725409 [Sparassis latifolia]
MKSQSSLQRGMACLNCRRKKMKCDGMHPICTPCSRSKKPSECQFHEKKQTSRAETLQQKIAKLEVRLRELESEQDPRLGSQPTTPTHASLSPVNSQNQTDEYSSSSSSSCSREMGLSPPQSSSTAPLEPFAGPSSSKGSSSFDHPNLSGSPSPFNYHDCGAFPQIPLLSSNWWEDHDTFCENKQMLLNIFFSHRHQLGFDVHMSRFHASLCPGSIKKPHPVLTDAIFLLGCLFSRLPHLSELQSYFLERAVQGIRDALQLSDHILNVLQASCLLAVYFFCHGRVLEGYYHSSTAARLAMDVGLHQVHPIDFMQIQISLTPHFVPSKGSSPLSPPQDNVEYAERVAAFWQIFAVDRAWSVATGLPPALPDDDHPQTQIETAWPMPIPDDPNPTENACGPGWSTVTLRAKAIMLFERTARLSGRHTDIDSSYYLSLEAAVAQFSMNLPSIGAEDQHGVFMASNIELVNIHTLICAAMIQLNLASWETQPSSHDKCIIAANAITSIIRQLQGNDYDYLDPISSTCWRCATDVFVRELTSPRVQRTQYTLDIVDQELDVLVDAMKRLSLLFPVAGGAHLLLRDG